MATYLKLAALKTKETLFALRQRVKTLPYLKRVAKGEIVQFFLKKWVRRQQKRRRFRCPNHSFSKAIFRNSSILISELF